MGEFVKSHKSFEEELREDEEELLEFIKSNIPKFTCDDCADFIFDPTIKANVCRNGYVHTGGRCPLWRL